MPPHQRQARPRRRPPVPRIPGSMVRATAFFPIPPWSAPSEAQAFGIGCSGAMMPTGISGIKVIAAGDGDDPSLADPISITLRDSTTIQVVCSAAITVAGVYIPFNDAGYRGITGGMLNPGEIAISSGGPRAFPWVGGLP